MQQDGFSAACTRRKGFSLIELLVVIVILGIAAAVAVPFFSSSDPHKLDLAAQEVANAIRFARSEALRTGQAHGVDAKVSAQRVRVYKLNTFSFPEYSVYSPVDKKLYDLNFNTDATLSEIQLSDVQIVFSGTARDYLGFSDVGVPKYKAFLSPTTDMLDSATIRLSYGSDERVITVAPMTGRVTVQ